ncbi:MAG: restriction endonuclease subunit S [Gemmatimonadales bacterium]
MTIAELASEEPYALATGPFGSAISAKNFVDHGVPVIRGSNLSLDVGTRLKDEGLAFLTEAKAAGFKRSVARRGDLVFTCWGTVGQIGLVDERSKYAEYVVSNKQMKLTPDPARVDSVFLYYLLSSPKQVRAVTGQAIGAAVPGFNLGQLKDIGVSLPPLDVQTQIAGVLNAFDDLIDNNRRRVEALEEMARAIYRE